MAHLEQTHRLLPHRPPLPLTAYQRPTGQRSQRRRGRNDALMPNFVTHFGVQDELQTSFPIKNYIKEIIAMTLQRPFGL